METDTDKFLFVALTISHTITLSRTRLPYLAHDYPISHTNTPFSHTITPILYTITPISYTISESVGMGFLLQTVEKCQDEHEL